MASKKLKETIHKSKNLGDFERNIRICRFDPETSSEIEKDIFDIYCNKKNSYCYRYSIVDMINNIANDMDIKGWKFYGERNPEINTARITYISYNNKEADIEIPARGSIGENLLSIVHEMTHIKECSTFEDPKECEIIGEGLDCVEAANLIAKKSGYKDYKELYAKSKTKTLHDHDTK